MKTEENISDNIKEAIISYYAGVLSDKEAEELLAWVDKSPDNLKRFHILGEIWHLVGVQTDYEFETAKSLNLVKSKISPKSD